MAIDRQIPSRWRIVVFGGKVGKRGIGFAFSYMQAGTECFVPHVFCVKQSTQFGKSVGVSNSEKVVRKRNQVFPLLKGYPGEFAQKPGF